MMVSLPAVFISVSRLAVIAVLTGLASVVLSKCFIVFLLEMVEAMKKVAIMDVELTVEERNLLSGKLARRRRWSGLSPSGLIIPRRQKFVSVFVRLPFAVGSPAS